MFYYLTDKQVKYFPAVCLEGTSVLPQKGFKEGSDKFEPAKDFTVGEGICASQRSWCEYHKKPGTD